MSQEQPSEELATLRRRVEELLGEAVRQYEQIGDRYEVPYQSTRLVVHPLDWTPGRTLLRIIAPVVINVRPSPELHAHLAELNESTIFGKLYVLDGTIYIEHNLLGESVDREQFRAVLTSIAHHADHLNEPLIADFGGRRWKA